MPDTEIKALHLTRRACCLYLIGHCLGVGMVIGVVMYIDDEFDGLRATMIKEFERMGEARADLTSE